MSSLFESFFGNAAGAGASILGERAKNEFISQEREKEARLQDELLTRRQKAIEAMREEAQIRQEDRAQERADAPLKRIGGLMDTYRNKEVPQEAAPVTALSGKGEAFDGQPLTTAGLPGDPAKWRKQVEAMPDGEDKTNILKQLDNQMASDTKSAQDAVAGKTRKLTADEAEKAALSDARASDPVAVAAWEKNIGRPDREEKRIDNQGKKIDAETADRNKRMDWEQTHKAEALELQREIARQKQERGGADAKDPSEVASTKWLMANKDDPVAMEMWNKVHQSKSKSVEDIAAGFMEKDITGSMTAAEAVKKATELSSAAKAMKQQKPEAPITQAEYAKLPSGAIFTAPDGTKRRKP